MTQLTRRATSPGTSRGHGPASVWALVVALAAAALFATLQMATGVMVLSPSTLVLAAALAAGFAAAEVMAVHLHFGRHAVSYSFSEIPLLLGVVLLPAPLVLAARAIGAAWGLGLQRRQPVQKLSFNLAHRWAETVLALGLWRALGTGNVSGPRGWFVVAGIVIAIDVLGSAVVALVIRLAQSPRPRDIFWRPLLAGLPAVAANSSIALLMITLITYDWRSLWMLGAVLALLVVFQRAHGQLQQRHATLERVATFGQTVAAELRTESVAAVTLTELRRQLSAGVAGLMLTPDLFPGVETVWDCAAGVTPPAEAGLKTLRATTAARVLERNSRDQADTALLADLGVRDALIVPLHNADGRIGTLIVGDRLGDAMSFSADDLQVCIALANNAAIALNNGRLASELHTQIRHNEHQALHDALTGLPNRRLFGRRLSEASGPVAALLIDLDRFKEINDTLGHHTGDELLKMVADRLVQHLPGARCVARLGGDEFAIGLDVDTVAEAVSVARQLRSVLAASFVLADMSLTVDASIGVATALTNADAGLLLQHADVAMYEAKTSRTGVELYAPEKDPSSHERLLLPGELRQAIAANELVVYYQPKVDIASDRVAGVEALVRWQHPRRGLVPPNEFIPMAEQAGLINALTQHVLVTALTQCRQWREEGYDLTVAVNVAPRTLHDEDFPDTLGVILAQTGCPATALTLEITEDDIMAEPARTIAVLERLAAMGVDLAVDDLGTGYSSLSYLRRLPVHEVKVDRSFVMNMAENADDEAIVEAIVALSHRLGKRIVAEGVEDERTYERLRAIGCNIAQGFWLSRPLPAADLSAWLVQWHAARVADLVIVS